MQSRLMQLALFVAAYFLLSYFIGNNCIIFVGLIVVYLAFVVGVSRA